MIQYEFMPDGKTADALKRDWWTAPGDHAPCPSISRFWWPRLPQDASRQAQKFSIEADIRLGDSKSNITEVIRAEYRSKLTGFMAESALLIHAERQTFVKQHIPPRYRMLIDRTRLKNPAAFDKVQAWTPEGERPGLVAIGDTGRGKTLAVYTRLAQLHVETGLRFIALTADSLKTYILTFSRRCFNKDDDEVEDHSSYSPWFNAVINPYPCDEDTLETFTNKLCNVGVLFIDDLSQAKMTPVYAERLFAIIENRTSHGNPLVVSIQMGKTALVNKLAGYESAFLDTADCLARRIEDYCQPVHFGRNSSPDTPEST